MGFMLLAPNTILRVMK